MFNLKRPCDSCPFRIGQGEKFQLSQDRLQEIFDAEAFQCHKTVVYGDDDAGPTTEQGDKPEQCYGLMSLLEHEQTSNTIMRVAYAFRTIKPGEHRSEETYKSFEEAIKAHKDE